MELPSKLRDRHSASVPSPTAQHARQTGHLDGAAEALIALLQQKPQDARTWVQLGDVKEEMGQIAEAEACFLRATEARIAKQLPPSDCESAIC